MITFRKVPKDELNEQLNELVPRYVQNKKQADHYMRLVKSDNEDIKDVLSYAQYDEYTVGDDRVFIVRSEKQEMDEDALIQKLKDMQVKGIVKKKEYVDTEALENALYHHRIKAEEIASCFNTKETISLRVGKPKA